ncbi:hypothetical protein P4282_23995 [Bacillus swezeyi]|uniref:hypothetical protein n=1 Tax=Bacillus swezeyi TaxID=1925020 RepID=UPI002E1E855A|nr:hypothetical protein [Bacillus swezeyi]
MFLEEKVLKLHSKSAKREQIFIEEYSKRLVTAVAKGDMKTAIETIDELRKSVNQLNHYIATKKEFDEKVEVISPKKFYEKQLGGMI